MTDSSTERIGRYQLLEPIGGGPNGSVWRAKVFGVAGFERQFAIKRFLPELAASPSTAQALSAAARAYGSLEHPRIARMSEFGVAQGQTFTAVELVAGLDAMRLVAESKLGGTGLSPGGTLALISQVARAVGYAHGRGLSHLGLSPSNVIVTTEGDVKVTDFGILASTMTGHPVESPRLGSRIGYIAPEQLTGETCSAATDVYVLGVIAYELVTGQRAFFGDSAQAVSQAILAGPPADPPLPRPIVRVLARCLARSQFERFPDARAFADALDAALRVAPVPGTRKEIGAQVKATLDRHAAMNDGNLSGMVALNLGAFAPSAPPPARDPMEEGQATLQYVRPDVPVPRPAPLVGPRAPSEISPGATLPELPRPMTTVPGLAAPIPVPQGVGGAQPTPPAIPPVAPTHTMLGIPPAKRPIPGITPRGPGIPAMLPSTTTIGRPANTKSPMEIPRIAAKTVSATRPPPLREEDAVTVTAHAPRDEDAVTTATPAPRDEDAVTTATHAALAELVGPAGELVAGDGTATVPYDLLPDSLAAESLADLSFPAGPTASPPRPLEPTETSPSIQVIRGSEPVLPEPRSVALKSRELPTHEMSPALREDLQRASQDSDGPYVHDPLVELALEAHGGAVDSPAAESQRPTLPSRPTPTSRPTLPSRPTPPPQELATPSPSPSLSPLGDVAHARDVTPEKPRMPSPSLPSLVLTFRNVEPSSRRTPAADLEGGIAAADAPAQKTTPGVGPTPQAPRARSFSLPSQQHSSSKRWTLVAVVALIVAGGGIAAWRLTRSEGDQSPTTGSGAAPSHAKGSASVASNMPATTGSNAAGSNAVGSNAVGSNAVGSNAVGSSAVGSSAVGSSAVGSNAIALAGSNAASTGATALSGSNAAGSNAAAAAGSNAVALAGSNAAARTGSAVGSNAEPHVKGTPTADALQIASTPPGARVFIDGADQGVTPVTLAGTSDRHTMALLLAGHDLYVAEVDGHGSFAIPLTSITPSGGPAGIKVIKCKDKDRYYVFVDGKPTGMMCPTERIDCTTGPHTVEVYDVVTETRRKWDITVTDTRLSYRVRVE